MSFIPKCQEVCICLSLKPLKTATGTGHKFCWELSQRDQRGVWLSIPSLIPLHVARLQWRLTSLEFSGFTPSTRGWFCVYVCVQGGHNVNDAKELWSMCAEKNKSACIKLVYTIKWCLVYFVLHCSIGLVTNSAQTACIEWPPSSIGLCGQYLGVPSHNATMHL